MKLRNLILPICFATQAFVATAQEKAPENWFNLDKEADKVQGVSTERAYSELLKGKMYKSVLVAVIDSGIDEEHEDLQSVMWKNPGEIAGNGIDDDKNGYIDDIYGWNFIGGKDGKNVGADTYEVTRMYKHLKAKAKLSKDEKVLFEKVKKEYEAKISGAKTNLERYQSIDKAIDILAKATGKKDFNAEDLAKLKSEDKNTKAALQVVGPILERSGMNGAALKGQLVGALNHFKGNVEHSFNLDFDPRKTIVKDDYENAKETVYGNNDVTGPDAGHGTHVAGIIGADRTNELGMKGVADHVRIMSVRAVPDGDERDKDVANAIRYAVDNGAKVINMSFGKAYAYNKKVVDKAVRYAEKKGVLLVHAAGNSHLDTDVEKNYPNKFKKDVVTTKPSYSNWIEVGALSWKGGADAPATFSNYGAMNVDVFAPGVDIYSTIPGSEYDSFNGTSMASPVVAGIAALVWSYYPELSVKEIHQIITESAVKVEGKVKTPGDASKMVEFSALCNTAGVANAYKAIQLAEKMSKK